MSDDDLRRLLTKLAAAAHLVATEYADLAQDATLKDRIVESLRRGMRTYEDIADELEESPDTVRRTLNRHKKNFVKQGSQWGVAYRE